MARKTGLRAAPQEYVLCRYQRHAWKFLGLYSSNGTINSVARCRDCGALKEQKMDKKAGIEGNRYEYPDGYLIHDGKRTPPVEVRREVLRRFPVKRSRADIEG